MQRGPPSSAAAGSSVTSPASACICATRGSQGSSSPLASNTPRAAPRCQDHRVRARQFPTRRVKRLPLPAILMNARPAPAGLTPGKASRVSIRRPGCISMPCAKYAPPRATGMPASAPASSRSTGCTHSAETPTFPKCPPAPPLRVALQLHRAADARRCALGQAAPTRQRPRAARARQPGARIVVTRHHRRQRRRHVTGMRRHAPGTSGVQHGHAPTA